MGRGSQRSADSIKTILDLSDRQFAELGDLVNAHNQKLKDLGVQIRDLDKQRREAAASGNTALATALGAQMQSLQQQVMDENAAYHENSLRVLDSAQREKVKQIEDALKLAPSAGALAQYGLLDTSQLPGGGRSGFMGGMGFGMGAGMMRGGRGPDVPGGPGGPPPGQ